MMTKKTQTKKQREAAQRNWQRLQLKGIIANVIKCEIIGQVDKEIIISLLKNALIKDMIRQRNKKVFKGCTFYGEKKMKFSNLGNLLYRNK